MPSENTGPEPARDQRDSAVKDRCASGPSGVPTLVKVLLVVVVALFVGRIALLIFQGPLAGLEEGGTWEAWKGKPAPELVMTTLDGDTIRLSDWRGKRRVVVNFWATWCSPCVAEIPSFNRLVDEVPTDELRLVGVTHGDVATLKAFAAAHSMNYPIATTEELTPPFSEVMYIPTTFVIDRDGVIQDVLVGLHEFEELKKHATGQ